VRSYHRLCEEESEICEEVSEIYAEESGSVHGATVLVATEEREILEIKSKRLSKRAYIAATLVGTVIII
jgi:hypothetical protein